MGGCEGLGADGGEAFGRAGETHFQARRGADYGGDVAVVKGGSEVGARFGGGDKGMWAGCGYAGPCPAAAQVLRSGHCAYGVC